MNEKKKGGERGWIKEEELPAFPAHRIYTICTWLQFKFCSKHSLYYTVALDSVGEARYICTYVKFAVYGFYTYLLPCRRATSRPRDGMLGLLTLNEEETY